MGKALGVCETMYKAKNEEEVSLDPTVLLDTYYLVVTTATVTSQWVIDLRSLWITEIWI